VSSANLTLKTAEKILKAFDEIHKLGVLHGDIRQENIIDDDDTVWIIDFELSRIFTEPSDGAQLLSREQAAAEQMLTSIFGREYDE
jgi:tRNA A-37 threonylcarbamoyl transferase component Bud32